MQRLKPVFKILKNPFKRTKLYLKQKAGWLGTPKIVPYRGFGNEKEIFIMGQVIEDKGLTKPAESHHIWQNILAAIKRFSSDEVPGVKIKMTFYDISQTGETDEKGFFSFHLNVEHLSRKLVNKRWHGVDFELLDQVLEDQPEIKASGELRIVKMTERRIIVSDIDDTVMVSHSTQTLRKLRLILFKNALTRSPFKGVAAFYRALEKGSSQKAAFHPYR